MTYAEFIAEIRRLAGVGDSLISKASVSHESREFRDWRHEVESTVAQIRTAGYLLPGNFASSSRHYLALWNATPAEHREAFNRAMGDSLKELRYIIDQYEKYGEPKGGATAPQPEMIVTTQPDLPLASPERVTLRWLIDHVPVIYWLWLAGGFIATFLIGVSAGQYQWVRDAVAGIKSLFTPGVP